MVVHNGSQAGSSRALPCEFHTVQTTCVGSALDLGGTLWRTPSVDRREEPVCRTPVENHVASPHEQPAWVEIDWRMWKRR